jgi:hypothetical protein
MTEPAPPLLSDALNLKALDEMKVVPALDEKKEFPALDEKKEIPAEAVCRICHDNSAPLLSPCHCKVLTFLAFFSRFFSHSFPL